MGFNGAGCPANIGWVTVLLMTLVSYQSQRLYYMWAHRSVENALRPLAWAHGFNSLLGKCDWKIVSDDAGSCELIVLMSELVETRHCAFRPPRYWSYVWNIRIAVLARSRSCTSVKLVWTTMNTLNHYNLSYYSYVRVPYFYTELFARKCLKNLSMIYLWLCLQQEIH